MLKLIPSEGPSKIKKIRKAQREKIISIQKKKNAANSKSQVNVVASIVQQKYELELEKEKGIIRTVCAKLIGFVKNTAGFTIDEINDTIHAMKRSILSLERQRDKIVRKERKKRNK